MNAKQLKFLNIFAELSKNGELTDGATFAKYFKRLLDLDYALAAEIWDYYATKDEETLASNTAAAEVIGQTVFDLFYNKASTKCAKAMFDAPAVRRAVFMYNPQACSGSSFTLTVDALAANKTAEGEEIFKCMLKNPHISYGKKLEQIQDRLFIEILKKNPSKKIEMSKKLSTLMLTYIAKIKTEERAMLEQRIRETL